MDLASVTSLLVSSANSRSVLTIENIGQRVAARITPSGLELLPPKTWTGVQSQRMTPRSLPVPNAHHVVVRTLAEARQIVTMIVTRRRIFSRFTCEFWFRSAWASLDSASILSTGRIASTFPAAADRSCLPAAGWLDASSSPCRKYCPPGLLTRVKVRY
jgi:hypothetical protein